MNAHFLNISLITSALAALTFNPNPKPASRPSHQSVGFAISAPSLRTEAREDWETALQGIFDNADTFRAQAARDIEEYALAAQAMSRRSDRSRNYLQTRLQALREHVDYARTELVKLPSSQGDADFTTAHAHFYRTMNGLGEAVTQALNELDDGA